MSSAAFRARSGPRETTMDEVLTRPPFNLDAAACSWVDETLQSMDAAARIRHLFVHLSSGLEDAELERIDRLAPAGVARIWGRDGSGEIDFLDALQDGADVPLLICTDLEGSLSTPPFATPTPNPLALAAIDDVTVTRETTRIMAEEARAAGVNWSFAPLFDISAAFRSSIVGTRSFGSDPQRVLRHALAQIDGFQAAGVAATAKHWPGEGFDDRDQHLVTTINPLPLDEWFATFGALYEAAIDGGVYSIMSGHIALPSFVRTLMSDADVEAFRPASISRLLNQVLLRERLGFNGLIVSDATIMGGLTSWGRSEQTVPDVVSSGCDVILFSDDPERDFGTVASAVDDGRISEARIEEALIRILGMKAALGLHGGDGTSDRARPGRPDEVGYIREISRRAPTLLKDVNSTLPVAVETHRRVLLHTTGITSPAGTVPLDFPDLMRAEGFDVTEAVPGESPDLDRVDLVLYLLGEESAPIRGRIYLDWARLAGGDFLSSMRRSWNDVPTVMISFGHPYHLYDAPRAPCVVNAYATTRDIQEATLECLLGRAPFVGRSPVDWTCGLPDAQY